MINLIPDNPFTIQTKLLFNMLLLIMVGEVLINPTEIHPVVAGMGAASYRRLIQQIARRILHLIMAATIPLFLC
jgi:hypothetical protein